LWLAIAVSSTKSLLTTAVSDVQNGRRVGGFETSKQVN